ncbi:MAG: alpha/beta fold hydrolase [Chloroflexi bacterium]|nr:MAG: alpha/beta fold hydrolase [Chloroflexota bacterium]MBL1196290.1 alpha/beta fold hydrolase [Chloroflexota bacterium]NOH13585.1 haloalkane dehalogenase [Chloroflexota bacterium]
MPEILRTPEERFENLQGYDFSPHYLDFNGARMHYVDEGAGDPILCLHGEPDWSYLYRKMIPPLSAVGRVLAPDLIGFGKSDKYAQTSDYSLQMHLDSLINFVEHLDLRDITIVVQDWGGLLGLPLAAQMPERFARLVIMNTFLPAGDGAPGLAFRSWKTFARLVPTLPVPLIMQLGTVRKLSMSVLRAYKAPYPSRKYLAGAKIFPELVPVFPDAPGVDIMKNARSVLRKWDKPAIVMFSDSDPILGGAHKFFRRLIPTTAEQPKITIRKAGHFLQEDQGEEIASHIIEFLERTPLK